MSIIIDEKIDKNDVLFIMDRGYDVKFTEYKKCIFPFISYPDSFDVSLNFWYGRKKMKDIDEFISKNIASYFMIYMPQTSYGFFSLIINNELCKGFNIIEEGIASYYDRTRFCYEKKVGIRRLIFGILVFMNYSYRGEIDKYFYDDRYRYVYGITDYAFRDYERRKIVKRAYCSLNDYCIIKINRPHILVFDAAIEYGIISYESTEFALRHLFVYLNENNVEKIYVKFHPYQYIEKKYMNKIVNLLKEISNHLSVVYFDASVCLEEIALNSDPTFYINKSSVGLYGLLAGCKVYSYSKIINKYDNKRENDDEYLLFCKNRINYL